MRHRRPFLPAVLNLRTATFQDVDPSGLRRRIKPAHHFPLRNGRFPKERSENPWRGFPTALPRSAALALNRNPILNLNLTPDQIKIQMRIAIMSKLDRRASDAR